MKRIWIYIGSRNMNDKAKLFAACMVYALISAAVGIAVWAVVKTWALSSADRAVCFAGYPAVTALLAVFIHYFSSGFEK